MGCGSRGLTGGTQSRTRNSASSSRTTLKCHRFGTPGSRRQPTEIGMTSLESLCRWRSPMILYITTTLMSLLKLPWNGTITALPFKPGSGNHFHFDVIHNWPWHSFFLSLSLQSWVFLQWDFTMIVHFQKYVLTSKTFNFIFSAKIWCSRSLSDTIWRSWTTTNLSFRSW